LFSYGLGDVGRGRVIESRMALCYIVEKARKDICDRPDEDGKIKKRPTSVRHLLGKSKWEKPLADWIMATGVGLLGNELRDNEAELVERNDGWRREPFV
jgi:hypothetical protein